MKEELVRATMPVTFDRILERIQGILNSAETDDKKVFEISALTRSEVISNIPIKGVEKSKLG